MKGRVCKNFVLATGWEYVILERLLDDIDISDIILGQIGAELCGGGRVGLDSDNMTNSTRKSTSNDTGTGTDFDNGVALF